MKKNIILVAIISTLISFSSCVKDENGYRITYYKNKTGEGYVFFVHYSDTLPLTIKDRIEEGLIDSVRPAPNVKIKIEAFTRGFMDTGILCHSDYVYTSDNGKYSFKLLKAINGKSIAGHHIKGDDCIPFYISLYHAIETKKGYIMDTLYIARNSN